MHLGMGEMLVVLVIALLVFGPSKVPQLGDALGKGIRNFKKAVEEPDRSDVPPAPARTEQALLPAASPAASPGAESAARSSERA